MSQEEKFGMTKLKINRESMKSMIRRNWRTIIILLALMTDTLAISASGVVAFFLRRLFPHLPSVSTSTLALFGAAFWLVLIFFGLVLGLYRATYHSNARHQYFLAGKSYIYSLLIILASLYVFREGDFPRRFTFVFFTVLPVFFAIGRTLLNRFNVAVQKWGLGIHNALLVGYENDGIEALRRFQGFPELGYEIKGLFSGKNNYKKGSLRIGGGLKTRSSQSRLVRILTKRSIDTVFIPSSKFVANGFPELLDICQRQGVRLKVLSPEADRLLRTARVYDIAGITLYSPRRTRIEVFRRVIKRTFDIIGSFFFIVLWLPIFLITALTIWIESGRPIFFKEKRSSSKGGCEFYFYKFRSMVNNANEIKGNLLQFNESDGVLFKIKNDPRITKVGRLIRKFSIDEFPQLYNVLKGDMSLVGPRPLPLADFERIDVGDEFVDAIKEREKAKPGMTGLWQISGRSHVGFKEMLLLDLYYIENQSLLFDIEILFATIPVVLFSRGAY